MARSLSSPQGGIDLRKLETTGRLQILEQMGNSSEKNGNLNPAKKSHPLYVGITPHEANRVEEEKIDKGNKKQGNMKKEKKNNIRRVEDGLLLVVSARVYGKTVKALIDSGATRYFVTAPCVAADGLKGIPRDIFLELGNGEKNLSRGYVPDVPVVTVGLTVKIGLTVINLLHDVDLVLGIIWLQLVNPVVDWCDAKLYLPNAVQPHYCRIIGWKITCSQEQ